MPRGPWLSKFPPRQGHSPPLAGEQTHRASKRLPSRCRRTVRRPSAVREDSVESDTAGTIEHVSEPREENGSAKSKTPPSARGAFHRAVRTPRSLAVPRVGSMCGPDWRLTRTVIARRHEWRTRPACHPRLIPPEGTTPVAEGAFSTARLSVGPTRPTPPRLEQGRRFRLPSSQHPQTSSTSTIEARGL